MRVLLSMIPVYQPRRLYWKIHYAFHNRNVYVIFKGMFPVHITQMISAIDTELPYIDVAGMDAIFIPYQCGSILEWYYIFHSRDISVIFKDIFPDHTTHMILAIDLDLPYMGITGMYTIFIPYQLDP